MFKKIRVKYFLISVIFFCLIAVGYYIYHTREYTKQKEISTNDLIDVIAEQIIANNHNRLNNLSKSNLKTNPQIPSLVYYYVIIEDNKGIIDYFNINAAVENNYLYSDINQFKTTKNNVIQKSYQFKLNEKNYAKLYVGIKLPKLNQEIVQNINDSAMITLIILLCGLLFSILISNLIYLPVKKILNVANSLNDNDFSYKILENRWDEFGILSYEFNALVDKITTSKNKIEVLNRQMKNLFKDKIKELDYEINQRKHFEEALNQSREQFRLLVELAPVGMVLTSLDNIITQVNISFCETTGYSSEELIHLPISNITYSDDWIKEQYLNKRLLDNDVNDLTDWPESAKEDWEHKLMLNKKMLSEDLSDIYFEKRFVHKSGKIIYAIVKSILLRDRQGRPLNFVNQIIDISERKKVEKELIRAKDKAEESDRLKSAFLAQMSHEIRTPLNVILNVTPIISDELAALKDEELNTLMESMDSAGKRLQRTIDLILNLSSIQSGNYEADFEVINAEKHMEKLIKELKPLALEKGLKINFECTSDSAFISADAYTFNQIFQNLIGNAIKYTKRGHIDVKIFDNPNGKVFLSVKDTGVGISENYLDNIYKPFSQEDVGQKREFEGNGLGLALVKKYVELNKADIKVDSIKNVGSTFTVIFDKYNSK